MERRVGSVLLEEAFRKACTRLVRLTRDRELAAELSQQALVEILAVLEPSVAGWDDAQILARYASRGHFERSVAQIAIFRFRNMLRERRRARPFDPADLDRFARKFEMSPEQNAMIQEVREIVKAAFRELSPRRQAALRARVEKTRLEDVARAHRVSVAALSRDARVALRHVRNRLLAAGIGPSAWSLETLRLLGLDWGRETT